MAFDQCICLQPDGKGNWVEISTDRADIRVSTIIKPLTNK